jgi:hypothetical protein
MEAMTYLYEFFEALPRCGPGKTKPRGGLSVPCATFLIQNEGYSLLSHFTLPESAWLDHFYLPMEEALARLEETYQGNKTALAAFGTLRDEIALYKKYSDYFGYAFFVMKKTDQPEKHALKD